MATLIDSYASTNKDYDGWSGALATYRGQAFTSYATALNLISCKFWLSRVDTPDPSNTTVTARLYAMTGTYGSSGKPTGAILATSDGILLSAISTTYGWVEFTFSTPYSLAANTKYCIAVGIPVTTAGELLVGLDNSSPTHNGNYFASSNGGSTWSSYSARDIIFEAYGPDISSAHTLTITYKNTSAATLATTYTDEIQENAAYSITSPLIPGYITNQLVVSGTMSTSNITVDVVYSINQCRLTVIPSISRIGGTGTTTITVSSNINAIAFEARATLVGDSYGRGMGANIISDDLSVDGAGAHTFATPTKLWTFDISYSEINTDGNYRITVYAKNTDNLWSTEFPYVTDGLLHYFNALGYRDNIKIWEDLSGNNHHTTVYDFDHTGSVGWTAEGLVYGGDIGDNVIIGDYAPFTTDGSFTFELYLKDTDYTVTQRLLSFGDSNGRFYFECSSSNGFVLAIGTHAFVLGSTSTFPPVNTLSHIVVVRNGTTVQLWINGIIVNSETVALTADTNVGRGFVIGSNYDNNYVSFSGTLVVHRFYNRPLSETEIKQNFINCDNVTSPYPFAVSPIPASSMSRMKDVLWYYSYPSSINNANGVLATAINTMSNYDIIILADALADTQHADYQNTIDIITGLKAVNASIEVFGYTTIGRSSSNRTEQVIKTQIDLWLTMGATGIFIDDFGFNYQCTRDWQNLIVDYCHGKGMNVIVVSETSEYVFTKENTFIDWIPFYGNPNNLEPSIDANDYIALKLLFYSYNTTTSTQYVTQTDRIYDVYYYNYAAQPLYDNKSYHEYFGTKIIGLDTMADNAHYFALGYLGAKILGMDAYGAALTYTSNSLLLSNIYPIPALVIENLTPAFLEIAPYNSIPNAQFTLGNCQFIWQSLVRNADCLTTEGTHQFLYNSTAVDTLADLAVP